MKFIFLFICTFIFHSVYAVEKQVGIYGESISLTEHAAEKHGIGTNLRSVGMSVSIRKPWLDSSAFQYSLGAGISSGKDQDTFSQEVATGFSTAKKQESSILGFSGFADIGHSTEFFDHIRTYLGMGSSYFSIERQITDCTDCERQDIDISFAPYLKIGMEFCGQQYCMQANYRQFITDEFSDGVFISFQGRR